MNEQESERARKRRSEGETGLNGERVLQTPTDAGTDHTPPDLNTHSYPPPRGAKSRRRGKTRSWGQRSGVGETALFLFCLLPEMTKK